jgi:adenylate cyclase
VSESEPAGPPRQPTDRPAAFHPLIVTAVVLLILAGLPLAVWLDLRSLAGAAARRQAEDINALVSSIRSYYTSNIVARVRESGGGVPIVHNYQAVPGAIPIPATLSIELGRVISDRQSNIDYRFVSDFPFRGRVPHVLDAFETRALATLRADAGRLVDELSWSGLVGRYRLAAPVIMSGECVACHNAHPESPKHDWRVGDVRGLQEVVITQPVAQDLFSFKSLLIYFGLTGLAGFAFVGLQHRQAALVRGANQELARINEFLAAISRKISRYLSPQIYRGIFSGERDVAIQTERKKLTIFFSDIKDFTPATERLQPEEMTSLLNEYLTEMSSIALKHGGTIDKFVGDAIVVFFGDPETRGVAEDARACLRMAHEMHRRLAELNIAWRARGIEHPFRARMGINSGFCSVGNFGSADRMDYTIIGAEANLAARLQSIAPVDSIVVSYETYALVRDIVTAHALPALSVKGISREVVPYVIDAVDDGEGRRGRIVAERATGLDLYLDLGLVDAVAAERVRAILTAAIRELEGRPVVIPGD